MLPFLVAQAQVVTEPGWSDGPGVVRTLLSLIVVIGLMAGCAWLVRRGGLQLGARRGVRAVQVETAVPLGDRRQLVIVAVEGRRLLLGVTPMQVSLVTELAGGGSFAQALDARVETPGTEGVGRS